MGGCAGILSSESVQQHCYHKQQSSSYSCKHMLRFGLDQHRNLTMLVMPSGDRQQLWQLDTNVSVNESLVHLFAIQHKPQQQQVLQHS